MGGVDVDYICTYIDEPVWYICAATAPVSSCLKNDWSGHLIHVRTPRASAQARVVPQG
jgi:hypothetical protein